MEKQKRKKSSKDLIREWAKKEGIEIRAVKGDGKVTAVFKPKNRKNIPKK